MNTKNDSNRLAIAIFIVATTITIMTTRVLIPTSLILPMGAFLMGLIVTAVLAFLFILAKGYELRYKKKKDTLVDKYNHILYNSAMTAYAIIMVIVVVAYLYKKLNEASSAGNVWGSIGVVILFVAIIAVINRKDIQELSQMAKQSWHKNHNSMKK